MSDESKELETFLSSDDSPGEAVPAGRGVRRPDAVVRERRRKVLTLTQSGLTPEQICDAINEEDGILAAEMGRDPDPVSYSTIYADLKHLDYEFVKRQEDFDKKYEVGKTLTQFDFLYEQTVQQYHEAPPGSPQRAKLLDGIRQSIEAKNKFLQSVGLVDKVADKQTIEHQNQIMNILTDEQRQKLASSLVELHLKNSQQSQQLPARQVVQVEDAQIIEEK